LGVGKNEEWKRMGRRMRRRREKYEWIRRRRKCE
jgi:hypothetical protein